jgi:hypothetical protein
MAAALRGGADHQPDPPLQPRAGAWGSEDAAVEDTVVDPTSDATGGLVVRAGASPFPFGMPPWTPTRSTLVVGAWAGINPFPAPPPPPRTAARPDSALTTALAAHAEYAGGCPRLGARARCG